MQIEIIDTKRIIFRVNGNDYMYIRPSTLMRNFGEYIAGKVKGSCMGWNIEAGFVSYNQIRAALSSCRDNRSYNLSIPASA